MRERWIQLCAATLCGLGACVTTMPTTAPATAPLRAGTRPAATQQVIPPPPAVTRHEPVAPPPPPPVAVVPPPIARAPVTQPVIPPPVVATTQPGPIDDRAAYAMGYAAGRRILDRLKEDGRTADDLVVMKGLIDGLGDRGPAYSPAELAAAVRELEAYSLQQHAEKMYADNPQFRKIADENLQKSRAVLDQNAEMAGVTVRPDGVQMQVSTTGTGRTVGNAKSLTLKNLRVSLADGTLVEATETDKTEKLVATDMLPALINAVRDMKVGTTCKIWLPPDKAYGLTGKPPVVGPNQAIEYEFELVGVE
jgi:FKBP-type peptidyl-prolyl cis-trans isomerase